MQNLELQFKASKLILFLFLFIFSSLSSVVSAATLNVGSGQQFKTIQAAVDFALPGDIIKVHPGTYHEIVTVTKSDLTIEAYDSKNPPELDGADQIFANSEHTWINVQGKIYRTTYDLPFAHKTPESFTFTAYGPSDSGTGNYGDSIMTVYEDDVWLRGYEGKQWNELSYPYNTLADLDPSTDANSESKRDIKISGRFMYNDSTNQLYVWTAKEHGEDHPSNHKYYIPILKNLVVIKAPRVTLRNLVLKHSYYFAISIESSGDESIVENCYIINTGPWAISSYNAKDVKILNNFIQLRGFYERQDYISVRFTILKNYLVAVTGDPLTEARNCEIAGNIVSGTYGIKAHGQNCTIHDNIVSRSQSLLISASVPDSLPSMISSGYLHNVKVYNNILHHADFSAFSSYNTWTSERNKYYGPTWFYRNVIYGVPYINKDGCHQSPCDSTPSIFIYHNTFVLGKGVVHHPYAYPVRKRTVYRNNIFQFRHNQGMEMYWIYIDKDPTKGWSYFPFNNGPDSDYNTYWRESIYNWSQIARFRLTTDTELQYYKVGEFGRMQTETKLDSHTIEVDPKFVHGNEFSTANAFNVKYDQLSDMDYKAVIAQGYKNLYNQHFSFLYNYFDVQLDSPTIDNGVAIPASWPDSVIVTDGKPDIGAYEHIAPDTTPPAAPRGLTVN